MSHHTMERGGIIGNSPGDSGLDGNHGTRYKDTATGNKRIRKNISSSGSNSRTDSSSSSSNRAQKEESGELPAEARETDDEKGATPTRKRWMETDEERDTPSLSLQLQEDNQVDRTQGTFPPVDSFQYPPPDPPRQRKKRRQHREDDRIS